MKKNNAIEFWRFVIISFVIMLHFDEDYVGKYIFFSGGYLGVDFFFILSGFFLVHNYERSYKAIEHGKQALSYLMHRISTLYPEYLLSFIVIMLYKFFNYGWNMRDLIKNLWDERYELTMTHYLGIDVAMTQRSIWYISVLIVLSYFIYYLIARNRETFIYFIAPISIILIYVYIAKIYGMLGVQTEYMGIIGGGLLRGFAGMSLGCICYKFTVYIRDKKLTKLGYIILNCFEVVNIISVFYILKNGFSLNDFTIPFSFFAIISISFINKSYITRIIDNKISGFLGSLNYGMYLNHLFICMLFVKYIPNLKYTKVLPLFFMVLILYTVLTKYIIKIIKKMCNSKIKIFKNEM
ncbi:acyltransferase [Clostridium botulinum]|nr:acyltransferase [Clostridium botulinum]